MQKQIVSRQTKKRNHTPRTKQSLVTELTFFQLANASPHPILITTVNAEICYVNPAWEELTGYTFSEVVGKNPRFLQSGKLPVSYYKKLWEALTAGKTFNTEELIDKKKNGKEFQVHSVFFPIQEKGKNKYFVQMLHDITQRKEIEKKKDALIGVASHELKTPITTLTAYVQMLEKILVGKLDKKEAYFLQNIKSQTQRLTGLINDLLSVSRLESGKLEYHFTTFDLNELVKKIIVDFQYSTDTHIITKDGMVTKNVRADAQRIEEVLINLLTNAIKYSPHADKVYIHLSNDKYYATVAVEDFGYGIGKEDQPHVFERFYRTKEKEEDKWLGLVWVCIFVHK